MKTKRSKSDLSKYPENNSISVSNRLRQMSECDQTLKQQNPQIEVKSRKSEYILKPANKKAKKKKKKHESNQLLNKTKVLSKFIPQLKSSDN